MALNPVPLDLPFFPLLATGTCHDQGLVLSFFFGRLPGKPEGFVTILLASLSGVFLLEALDLLFKL